MLIIGGIVVAIGFVAGLVIASADAARYSQPQGPQRGRAYLDETVGDIGHDEIVVEPEFVDLSFDHNGRHHTFIAETKALRKFLPRSLP